MTSAALPGDWDGLVVIWAGTSWDGIWFPEKHVAHRLARHVPVLYVDPPISALTARRVPELAGSFSAPRLRLVRPGLARLTPHVLPGMSRPGLHQADHVLARRDLARAVRRLGGSVHAVVTAAPADPFGVCGEQRSVVFATDDWVAGAALMGLPERRVRRAVGRLAHRAGTVVAISPALQDTWRALGQEAVLVPNGCDDALFAGTDDAPVAPDVALEPPIAGFIGHLSDRIDLRLLEAVAERGRSLLLVGPRQATFELARMETLLARPNVQWVGARPFEALPSYLKAMSVGLTPYTDNAFNRASFPLKTLEYLAGGRAAVATALPAVAWLGTDLIRVASEPGEFADAVDAELDRPAEPADASRRQRFAGEHGWAARTTEFARAIGIDIPVAAPTQEVHP